MCPLHLTIFLEISGAVAFLHSLLMRLVVASDNVADAIFYFSYLRCFATSIFSIAVSYTHLTLPTTPYV